MPMVCWDAQHRKWGNALELGTHCATNRFKFVDMHGSGCGAIVLLAKTHSRLCSSSSHFVRSISTFLRAARFGHMRNHAEARASTYSLRVALYACSNSRQCGQFIGTPFPTGWHSHNFEAAASQKQPANFIESACWPKRECSRSMTM